MKEIFDRRYPVTSFFLLVTALVFLLMLVTAGGNFDRADTLFQFGAMYGPAIRLFPEQVWRLFSAIFGVSSLPFLFILGGSISLSICFRFIILVGK